MKIGILGRVQHESIIGELDVFTSNRTNTPYFSAGISWKSLLGFYKEFGELYGVRWDIAFFQSCLETGFFSFEGDVSREQNNFAGIGATGDGVPGESYTTPAIGIKAQMQILAIRAGIQIPRLDMISERYRKYYDVVFGKAHTWDKLAGTWAADLQYWDKIQAIARQFRTISGLDCLIDAAEQPTEPQDQQDITWWEFNRTDDGKPCVTGYNGSTPTTNLWGGKTADLIRALTESGAGSYLVADTRSKVIPDVAEWPDVEPIAPSPDRRLAGFKILLDPGHSKSRPGAQGLAPDYTKEHDLNLLQAVTLVDLIRDAGGEVAIYDPDDDDLTAIGRKASGHDIFISLHHNAFDRDLDDEYTCVMVHKDLANEDSKRFASAVAKSIAKKIGNKLFQASGEKPGVYPAGLSVLRAAHQAKCPICVLTESYFLDAYGSTFVCRERSKKAAVAIFEALIGWYQY